MTFQVGDFIIMKARVPYFYTKYKSTGVVKEISDTRVLVEFDFLTGGSPSVEDPVWWVDKKHCKITKQLTPQEKVCVKIKQMEARWQKFQHSRKEV